MSPAILRHPTQQQSLDSSCTSLFVQSGGTDFSKYKIRAAILQHTLERKQSESILLKQKLKILQDVIQKLQKSNKNLLEKLEHQCQEKEGIHVKNSDVEIWPPDMQIQLIKEDFEAKEAQWKNALRIGHTKYVKTKQENKNLTKIIEEKERDLTFYAERSKVDESEINLLKKQMEEKDNLIHELQTQVETLMKRYDAIIASQKEYENKCEALELSMLDQCEKLSAANNKIELQAKQLSRSKSRLTDLGDKWNARREDMQEIIERKSHELEKLHEQLEGMMRSEIEKDGTYEVNDVTMQILARIWGGGEYTEDMRDELKKHKKPKQ